MSYSPQLSSIALKASSSAATGKKNELELPNKPMARDVSLFDLAGHMQKGAILRACLSLT
jgi:hypothetical protein